LKTTLQTLLSGGVKDTGGRLWKRVVGTHLLRGVEINPELLAINTARKNRGWKKKSNAGIEGGTLGKRRIQK